jgi:hypothetical protein
MNEHEEKIKYTYVYNHLHYRRYLHTISFIIVAVLVNIKRSVMQRVMVHLLSRLNPKRPFN